jgi:Na+-driven multidrug efflux pump
MQLQCTLVMNLSSCGPDVSRAFSLFRFFAFSLFRFFAFSLFRFFAFSLFRSRADASLGSYSLIAFSMLAFIYRPKIAHKFKLYKTFFTFDRHIYLSFAIDSGFLLGKGVFVMFPLMFSPIVSGRLNYGSVSGETLLGAYQVLSQLLVFATFLSQAIGVMCTMIGGHYLGSGRIKDLKELMWRVPLITLWLLGVPIAALFWFLKTDIIHLFASSPSDINIRIQLELVWVQLCAIQPIAALVGVYEGLLFATKTFQGLFWFQIGAVVLFYVPIAVSVLVLDLEWKYLIAALAAYFIMRFLPLPFLLHVVVRKKLDRLAEMPAYSVCHSRTLTTCYRTPSRSAVDSRCSVLTQSRESIERK